MAISFVNQAYATGTQVTYPTGIQAGDYLIYVGYATSAVAPTNPTGYTNITTGTGNVNGIRVSYAVAVGTESGTTSPVFTNAAQVYVGVYRGVGGIGGAKNNHSSASPAGFTSQGLNSTVPTSIGNSWMFGFIGSKQGTSTATPSGATLRGTALVNGSTSMIAGYDTNGAVTSSTPFGNSALGVSTGWCTANFELICANPTFLEPGGDSTYGIDLLDVSAGTPVVATDFVHGGHTKSIKYATGTATSSGKKGVFGGVTGRLSFSIYINAYPAATASICDLLSTGFGNAIFVLRITTTGVLQLFNSGAQIGSNGSTVPTGAWHRISIAFNCQSSSVWNFQQWLDGSSSLNISNGATLSAITPTDFIVGNVGGDTTLDVRTSDHYADDSGALTDPGNIWATAKRPISNGTTNGFTAFGSPSGIGSGNAEYVNYRPITTSNGVAITSATPTTEEYNIEAASAGDIDVSTATYVGFMGWVYAKSTLQETTDQIITQGTVTSTPFVTTPTTATVLEQMFTATTTYPTGNTDIGLINAAVSTTYDLYDAGVVVGYIPLAFTTSTSSSTSTSISSTSSSTSISSTSSSTSTSISSTSSSTSYSTSTSISSTSSSTSQSTSTSISSTSSSTSTSTSVSSTSSSISTSSTSSSISTSSTSSSTSTSSTSSSISISTSQSSTSSSVSTTQSTSTSQSSTSASTSQSTSTSQSSTSSSTSTSQSSTSASTSHSISTSQSSTSSSVSITQSTSTSQSSTSASVSTSTSISSTSSSVSTSQSSTSASTSISSTSTSVSFTTSTSSTSSSISTTQSTSTSISSTSSSTSQSTSTSQSSTSASTSISTSTSYSTTSQSTSVSTSTSQSSTSASTSVSTSTSASSTSASTSKSTSTSQSSTSASTSKSTSTSISSTSSSTSLSTSTSTTIFTTSTSMSTSSSTSTTTLPHDARDKARIKQPELRGDHFYVRYY